jgi:hypothetical protein
MGEHKEKELENKYNLFLENTISEVSPTLKSKILLRLGNWIFSGEELEQSNAEKILQYYVKSLKFNPQNHKTYHFYALVNLEAAKIQSANNPRY